jgi:hypothetical protein
MGRFYNVNGKQMYGEHVTRIVSATGAWAAGAALADIALDRDFIITNIRVIAHMTCTLAATAVVDAPKRALQTLQIVGDSKTFLSMSGGVVGSQLGRMLAFINKFDNQCVSLGQYVDVGSTTLDQIYNFHPGHNPKNRFDMSVILPARALSNLVARIGCPAAAAMDSGANITAGTYTIEIDGVSGIPITKDMYYPGAFVNCYPHTAITGTYGHTENVPTGGYVRRLFLLTDDATAVTALRSDAQITSLQIKLPKDSTDLMAQSFIGLKYANAQKYAIDGDDQPVALGAVASTRTGFDGSAALPVGFACVDFRDYFDPVLGLNMVNASEGDAQVKETIAVATGQTAHYWDIVYPMDPMWVGK